MLVHRRLNPPAKNTTLFEATNSELHEKIASEGGLGLIATGFSLSCVVRLSGKAHFCEF